MKSLEVVAVTALSILLSDAIVSQRCLRAQSFTGASLVFRHQCSPQRRPRIERAKHRMSTPSPGKRYRSSLPSTPCPHNSPPLEDFRFARIFLKSLVSAMLSTIVVLGGPDAVRISQETVIADLSSLRPPAALALTEEQEVINDVWRVVNAAYVDPTFNGQDWKSIRMKVGVFYDGMRQIDGSASEARRMMPGNKLWREHILTLKRDFHNREEAYAAVKGMLNLLGDPFTRFLTPKEYEALTQLASGGVAGVGLELAATPPSGSQPSSVVVAGVVEGSPAEKAGVMTGDLLTGVNGNEAVGADLDTAAAWLRGNPGSSVRLDVRRGSKTMAFPLTREQFKFRGVTSKLKSTSIGNKVGVVTIKGFSKDTYEDVRVALARSIEEGAEAILLDLRHNPGGFFPGGIDVARLFLHSDETIVSVVDRHGISDRYSTVASGQFSEVPLVLVVDEKTASASEILSAALKDNGRAKLAGHKTFGKAKVQTLNQIFDGSGVAVTISLYKTPSGADINGRGIPVDFSSNCPYPGDALKCVPAEAWS